MYNRQIIATQNRIIKDLTGIIEVLLKSRRNPYSRKQSKSTLVINRESKESEINDLLRYLELTNKNEEVTS